MYSQIFGPVEPLVEKIARVQKQRNDSTEPLAEFLAGADTYEMLYNEAIQRLNSPDMLSVEAASGRLGISIADYLKEAQAGRALLIEIEGLQVVPECIFGKDGNIDQLKLDIAREFSIAGRSYFKFLDFISFMTDETADVAAALPQKSLNEIFRQAGIEEFKCSLSVEATMNQLADGRGTKPAFFALLIRKLDAALTSGGHDPSGGISRPFRDKYSIPGLTIDEELAGVIPKQQRPKSQGPAF